MWAGVGDRMAARCRYFAREAVLRWGAWAKADPSKPRVPFMKRLERFNQALVKLQAMGPSKTQTDAVLSVVTMQREAVIREGAMESLLCRQMHMIAPQPEDAYGLSLLTEQRKACVRAAATSALWNQLQRKMSQATEGLHLESALLTLVDLLPRIFFALAKVRMAREALTGSQPVDDTSEDVAEDLTKHGDHTSGSA